MYAFLIKCPRFKANIEVDVPKEHHGFIIGKEGSKLRALEQEYFCRIYMPQRDEKSGVIKLVGPNEHIIEAARRVSEMSQEMVRFLEIICYND
jgi:predicted RNA-binding protein Jag